jgi:hypothetical protein
MGHQSGMDKLILSMNCAAEAAARRARPLMIHAAQNMEFRDPQAIVSRGGDAATDTFKWKSTRN